jgi:hypothetical protein
MLVFIVLPQRLDEVELRAFDEAEEDAAAVVAGLDAVR